MVGVLDLGAGEPVLYAVAADAGRRAGPPSTSSPPWPRTCRSTSSSPVPSAWPSASPPAAAADWVIPHVKMVLPDDRALPPPDPRVDLARRGRRGRGRRPAGDRWRRQRLLPPVAPGHRPLRRASRHRRRRWPPSPASTCCPSGYGVAAVGNVLTHPTHRRQGLARALMATLARRLLDTVPVVGLNVGTANTGARALYDGLGFVPVVTYEEAELRRGSVGFHLHPGGEHCDENDPDPGRACCWPSACWRPPAEVTTVTARRAVTPPPRPARPRPVTPLPLKTEGTLTVATGEPAFPPWVGPTPTARRPDHR